ncbi:MAG TPA: hypothetical protein VLE44_02245 [Candidatus Saccharimonadales bacterium]|nr:hypothetical protein [Candidatus Saccharimonadales bacterium]
MGNERIKFGKHPDTYTQGLARLTPKDDPRIKHDRALETLYYLRKSLESVDTQKLSLPERMTKLNREEIELLEENGFKRGKKIFGSNWTFPDIGSDWADLYNINTGNYDNKYSFWKVTEMTPDYPDQRRYKLICIYTHQEFGKEIAENSENEQFYLGLVTRNELKELKKTLQRFTDFKD